MLLLAYSVTSIGIMKWMMAYISVDIHIQTCSLLRNMKTSWQQKPIMCVGAIPLMEHRDMLVKDLGVDAVLSVVEDFELNCSTAIGR